MAQLKVKHYWKDQELSVQTAVDNVLNDADWEADYTETLHKQVGNLITVVSILCEALVNNNVLTKEQLQSIVGHRYRVE